MLRDPGKQSAGIVVVAVPVVSAAAACPVVTSEVFAVAASAVVIAGEIESYETVLANGTGVVGESAKYSFAATATGIVPGGIGVGMHIGTGGFASVPGMATVGLAELVELVERKFVGKAVDSTDLVDLVESAVPSGSAELFGPSGAVESFDVLAESAALASDEYLILEKPVLVAPVAGHALEMIEMPAKVVTPAEAGSEKLGKIEGTSGLVGRGFVLDVGAAECALHAEQGLMPAVDSSGVPAGSTVMPGPISVLVAADSLIDSTVAPVGLVSALAAAGSFAELVGSIGIPAGSALTADSSGD